MHKPTEDLEPLRFSRLKLMAKSAAHYAHGSSSEGGALRKGSALHAYLLGQSDRVVVYEGGARNPRFKAWQEFEAAHEGKHILIPSEIGPVEGMRKSLESHPRAMELLSGIQEERIEWDIAGRACAGTPDVVHLLPDGSKRLVELKTSRTADPNLLKWHAKNLAYHAQVAWYAHGLEQTMAYARGPVTEVYVVAVESVAPYPVTVLRVCESMLERGRRQWRLWFERLRVCESTGHFPAYVEGDIDWEDEGDEGVELNWDDEEAAQ